MTRYGRTTLQSGEPIYRQFFTREKDISDYAHDRDSYLETAFDLEGAVYQNAPSDSLLTKLAMLEHHDAQDVLSGVATQVAALENGTREEVAL